MTFLLFAFSRSNIALGEQLATQSLSLGMLLAARSRS